MENKKETPTETEKKNSTDKRKRLPPKVTNYLVYTAGAILFVCIVTLLFRPKDNQETQPDVETTLPDPATTNQELAKKEHQYEQLNFDAQTSDRNYGPNLDDMFTEVVDNTNQEEEQQQPSDPYTDMTSALEETQQTMEVFQQNRNQNQQQQSPEESPGKTIREEELESEAALLRRQLAEQKETSAMLETLLREGKAQEEEEHAEQVEQYNRQVAEQASQVDILPKEGSDGVVSMLSGYAHTGFYGMGGQNTTARQNTIRASVYGKQVITNGQQVRLRLSEPMMVGGQVMPAGAVVTGVSTIGVDRLYITVTGILINQVLTTVSLDVYDLDGQKGLYVPGSMENEALRDLGKELTNSLANTTEQSMTSLVSTTKASEQLKTDLARGAIQGTSRFIGKKLDQIKITVQDGHRLLLYPNH